MMAFNKKLNILMQKSVLIQKTSNKYLIRLNIYQDTFHFIIEQFVRPSVWFHIGITYRLLDTVPVMELQVYNSRRMFNRNKCNETF